MSSRYWQRVYENNPTLFEDRPWQKKYCQVPGNICDTKTHQCLRKFEKWYSRPVRSHLFYWRLHKND